MIMGNHRKPSGLGLALAVALVALPTHVAAQATPEPQQQQPTDLQQEACSAQLMPVQVEAGEAATQVTITVSQPIGEVTGVEAPEGSGIRLASAADLPRTPLAAPDEAPEPIRMGDAANTWIVYLNLADAEAGQHELTFNSSRGDCTAQITVN
jgi:hypothetical protein